MNIDSGAGTNLKVGAPVRCESGGGAPVRRKSPEKIFWSCPSTFFGSKGPVVVLVSAFVMVSTVWSLSCLLFFYTHDAPRAQPFVKVGGDTCSPVPYGIGATKHCMK